MSTKGKSTRPSAGLQTFKDELARSLYGRTMKQAHDLGICIDCGQPTTTTTPVEKAEYLRSGLCPNCFEANSRGYRGVQ